MNLLNINVYGKDCQIIEKIDINIPQKGIDRAIKVSEDGYIYSFVVNAAQGNSRSANVKLKSRGEVRGGGKKPWKQKGTGNARQGSTRSPHWVGGGVVFGPQGRDYTKKINKKVLSLFLLSRFVQMINADRVLVVEARDFIFDTKSAANFVGNLNLNKSSIFFSEVDKPAVLSFRNLSNIDMLNVHKIDLHRLFYSQKIIFTKSTLVDYMKLLRLEDYNDSDENANDNA